jgi:hypothetical protein
MRPPDGRATCNKRVATRTDRRLKMKSPIRILLQTTIAATIDDWSIARFSLLAKHLGSLRAGPGNRRFEITARDRDPLSGPDSVLSVIDQSEFDQLWLFGVDAGDGLTPADCQAISRFRAIGRGLVITRDHMDLGASVTTLGDVGAAQHFHSRNIDPDALQEVDDPYTTSILWPNFHSGANGDYQVIEVQSPPHPVLVNPESPTGLIRFLPAHPHEGAVSAPPGDNARVIATGRSKVTGRVFNLAVAFESTSGSGRAIAQSTFHHFSDYNWNPAMGRPSFATEPAGDGLIRNPEALADVHRYARNVALWLANLTTQ